MLLLLNYRNINHNILEHLIIHKCIYLYDDYHICSIIYEIRLLKIIVCFFSIKRNELILTSKYLAVYGLLFWGGVILEIMMIVE